MALGQACLVSEANSLLYICRTILNVKATLLFSASGAIQYFKNHKCIIWPKSIYLKVVCVQMNCYNKKSKINNALSYRIGIPNFLTSPNDYIMITRAIQLIGPPRTRIFHLFPVRSKVMCFWSCTMLIEDGVKANPHLSPANGPCSLMACIQYFWKHHISWQQRQYSVH